MYGDNGILHIDLIFWWLSGIALLHVPCVMGAADPGCPAIDIEYLSGDSGLIINSPDYPSDYWTYGHVCWIVRCSSPCTMSIEVKYLFSDSSFDELTFYDGYVDQTLIGELSAQDGTVNWQHYVASTEELFITFYSHPNYIHRKRFELCVLLNTEYRNCEYAVVTTEAPVEDTSGWTAGGIAGLTVGVVIFILVGPVMYAICKQDEWCACKKPTCKKSSVSPANQTATTANTQSRSTTGARPQADTPTTPSYRVYRPVMDQNGTETGSQTRRPSGTQSGTRTGTQSGTQPASNPPYRVYRPDIEPNNVTRPSPADVTPQSGPLEPLDNPPRPPPTTPSHPDHQEASPAYEPPDGGPPPAYEDLARYDTLPPDAPPPRYDTLPPYPGLNLPPESLPEAHKYH